MRLPNFGLISISFIGLLSAQAPPVVAEGGVLNAASYVKGQPVALGSFVAIFGSGFGTGAGTSAVPWPTSVGGTTVSMNGVPAPLYAVTDGQINAQVPFEALPAGQTSGSVTVIVKRGDGQSSAVKSFQVAAFAPGIFSIGGNGLGLANAISPDGALAAPAGAVPPYASHPATPGGTIIVLATGLGVTDSPIPSGKSSIDVLRNTTTLPSVMVGGIPAQVKFSGLSPQFPAVNQLNIVLPVGVPAGSSVPLQVSVGGITTTAQLNIAIASTATATLSPVTTVLTPSSQPRGLAFYGNFAYLCGSQYIAVLDISNPASPRLTATAGNSAFSNVGNMFCYVESGNLVAFTDTGSTLVAGTGPSVTVFSLANPAQPQLLNQSAVNRTFVSAVAHRGNTAFASYDSISFSGSTFTNQGGDFISVDVSNPASPRILSALSGNTASGGGGPTVFFDLIAVNETTAYAASSTSTGAQTAIGSGVLVVVDTSDPGNLKVVRQVSIPGTRQVGTIRLQGNLAVTVNNVEGWRNPIDFSQGALVGPTSVSTFDISDPRNPVLLKTAPANVSPGLGGGGGAPTGTGQFAFGGTRAGNQNGILLVDARNPQGPQMTTLNTPDILRNVFVVAPNYLYALIDNTGLAVYQITN